MADSPQARERYRELLGEYDSLDKGAEPRRAAELLCEAALLVDKSSEPKKWAALNLLCAQFRESFDPGAALRSYRDALTALDEHADHDLWSECHCGIGTLMVGLQPFGTAEQEEAIGHLEASCSDRPYLSSLLALLYRFRTVGDPLENWRKRVGHLRVLLAQASREASPEQWAAANNELGIALEEEPDADFNAALETRIRHHIESFEVLGQTHGAIWVDTCCYLAECYLFRGGIAEQANQDEAERYARLALEALQEHDPAPRRLKVLLTMAKVATASGRMFQAGLVREGLAYCDQAAALVDASVSPALAASVESFRANAYLKLLQHGEAGLETAVASHVEAAIALLQGDEHLRSRRMLLQVAGDGMLAAGKFDAAAGYLQRALENAEVALAVAESREARMERIWEFRDSSSLLGYCLLKLGETDRALVEIEKGKARFWRTDGEALTAGQITSLVPPGGALLFPDFAGDEGVVLVVTASGSVPVWLPSFGKARLMELQRGGVDSPTLGGWLLAYHMRNTRPAEWRSRIDATGELLYRELWQPVVQELLRLGVRKQAELVWFPQGGSGVFPVHAAWVADGGGDRHWLLDDYCIRYAPSARALLAGAPARDSGARPVLVVANPCGDLDFSELECAWVGRAFSASQVTMLHGADALPSAVLDAVAGTGVAHFSTHAVFDLNRPLHSALLLAGARNLRLESLIPAMQGNPPGLVVLSACETAMSRVSSTPDEFLGFPAAFLHAGSRSVLATLWPVDDAAAALLVGRFYHGLSVCGLTPARALLEAQRWLRRVTVWELLDILRGMKGEAPPVGSIAARVRTGLRQFDPDFHPFAEPYFWAAFTISGKE